MSEQERYEELKDKYIVVSKPDMSKVSDIDIEAYKNFSTKEAKKPIKRIAEMLGIHNVNYKNSNIEFDFGFSKKNLDVSLHHQGEYGGNYADYAEMLTCLDKLVENLELIEVHKNYKGNENLKKTYVLISAFSDKSNVAPVQLEVKNFENQPNGLYLNVVLSKIKKSAVVKGKHNGNTDISNPLVAVSSISLSQLFVNVNPSDKRFLKYVWITSYRQSKLKQSVKLRRSITTSTVDMLRYLKMAKTVAKTNSPSPSLSKKRAIS